MNRFLKIFVSLVLIISNISCDQITKEKAREEISKNEKIEVVNDNFILTKVENTGAALSLGENLSPELKTIFLQGIPLLVLMIMFVYVIRDKKISNLNVVAFSFIIGGGIGNIYDRILYNSVTDFMYLELGPLHTGIFNMADVSVVVGVILLFLNYVITKVEEYSFKSPAV